LTITKPATRFPAAFFLGGGFCLLALVVVMSVLYGASERTTNADVQAGLVTEARLADTISTVRQAESGLRGYMLTGNNASLATYNMALATLPPELAQLDRLLANGPDAGSLTALHQIVAAKLTQMAQALALCQSGQHAAAVQLVNTDLNLGTMQSLRSLIGQMETNVAQRIAAAQALGTREGWVVQAATALAVFITIFLGWFAIRDNQRQTSELLAAETRLIEANILLELKVAERTANLAASEAALLEANATLEQRVAERSGELDRIFKLSSDILVVSDANGKFLRLSPAWEHITGHPVADSVGRYKRDFVHPDDLAATLEILQQVQDGVAVLNFENRYRKADGSYCWLAWRAVPLHEEGLAYSVARDITADRLKDEQLRQSQKMELVGQLTGGVAHDFNNLLTVIMGNLEMLQRSLDNAEPKIQRRVDNAMEGARRAATLTHRLLAFARRSPLEPKATDANRLIAGMSDMLHRTLGETIAIELVASAGLWPTLADGNQLENAILNLAVNARDAMPDGGRLTIETQNTYLDEDYAATRDDVEPGQYVMIAVTDTGCGMSKAVYAKVFEPFFTTKPAGQGTGLGLAQVYGFIKQSGGHVAIYSEPGEGTAVKLYLPRLRGAQVSSLAGDSGPDHVVNFGPRGQGETILVVEDEAGVRNFAAEVLEERGYKVLTAENGPAALKLFEHRSDIRLLFTDVVLSGPMNGRQLADEIQRRRPDTAVVFTTGYTRNAIIHHGKLDDGINFIGKPFTASALAQKIQKVLRDAPMEKRSRVG
jgi:PAS domain S-box-containing protein